jgi:sugar lactone lactonase YvrE
LEQQAQGGNPARQISVAQSFPAPGSRAEGIAWDGGSLWVSDNSGVIFKVDPTGKVVDSFRAPDVTPQGLTWDGSGLWVFTTNHSFIYKVQIDGENLRTISSFRSPAQVLGGGITQDMAWDGENLWYANQFKVSRLDRAGKVLSSFTFHKNVTGLGCEGANLWLAYNDFPQKAVLSLVDRQGEILETYVSPVLEINGLALAEGNLWALGSDSVGGNPKIYKLSLSAR